MIEYFPMNESHVASVAQLEKLCRVVALLSLVLELPIDASSVMTHCEAASRDGYGPGSGDPETRWDLFWVRDELGQFHQGGVFLRELARQFSTRLVPTKRSSAPQNTPTQEAPLQVPLFME